MDERQEFLNFASRILDRNYAQRVQDVFALWHGGLRTNGYFVEFGAMDGINFSNSYMLERLGWSGIVSEPHPRFGEIVRKNRACHVTTDCIWTEDNATVTFQTVVGRPALSGIAGLDYDDAPGRAGRREHVQHHEVPTIRLETLMGRLGAPHQPDFLSIDTEGSELSILSDFDFSKFRFKMLTVEHGFSSQRQPLYDLLTAQGYQRKWPEISDHDDWYVHASVAGQSPASAAQVEAFLAGPAKSLPQNPRSEENRRRSFARIPVAKPETP